MEARGVRPGVLLTFRELAISYARIWREGRIRRIVTRRTINGVAFVANPQNTVYLEILPAVRDEHVLRMFLSLNSTYSPDKLNVFRQWQFVPSLENDGGVGKVLDAFEQAVRAAMCINKRALTRVNARELIDITETNNDNIWSINYG